MARRLSPNRSRFSSRLDRSLRAQAEPLSGQPRASASNQARQLAAAKARLHKSGFDRGDDRELCDEQTLQPVAIARPPARLFVAAYIGKTRLIDNWPVI